MGSLIGVEKPFEVEVVLFKWLGLSSLLLEESSFDHPVYSRDLSMSLLRRAELLGVIAEEGDSGSNSFLGTSFSDVGVLTCIDFSGEFGLSADFWPENRVT